ncbi:alpha-L-fucosidase [Pelagicoccus mobilis]|uniref:alpha-L-fucosidase n=1 Tax=Pelagicoccus mobilis TaxID=415221 RepID=A0A934RR80_9BACT|nr:alpha-L-fucosidase [Pelagicoccus mobilis]MBK1876070.1 alpha-L-fucosidase [Pelagicoccus mobilis]
MKLSLAAPLSLALASLPLAALAEPILYPDENRAPLGIDAQNRVIEMEKSEHRRPHFRIPAKEYREGWEKLRDRPVPQWLEDGKFGIYTHWGLYSVAANPQVSNTYVRYMYKDKSTAKVSKGYKEGVSSYHKERFGDPTEFGYSDLTKEFTCEGFDGQEYVDIMKDAGAKFGGLCIVHHDGYLLWDSDVVPWNTKDMGPGRDIYGEFVEAAKNSDFKTIATFHHARSFEYASATLNPDDFTAEEKSKLDIFNPKFDTWFFPSWGSADAELFNDLWLKKVKEVIDKYSPDSLWFDGLKPAEHCTEESHLDFMNYYYDKADREGREVTVFNKLPGTRMFNFPQGVGIKCYEGGRDQPPYATGPFLVDKAISYPWSWVENKNYKFGPDYHIDALIDMTARGGYYFMSLTPKGDGSIPEEEKRICAEIGKWLRVNGDAIYGTRMWKIATEGPLNTFMYKAEKGTIYWDYRKSDKEGEIRFTQKGDDLYAIFLDWSEDTFSIRSLGKDTIPDATIESIELLGFDEALNYEQTGDALTIKSPSKKPHKYAYAFKIKLSGNVGDKMVIGQPVITREESMTYDAISQKHTRNQ